jgi:hypothetical protein
MEGVHWLVLEGSGWLRAASFIHHAHVEVGLANQVPGNGV